jgi:hypothetical protein
MTAGAAIVATAMANRSVATVASMAVMATMATVEQTAEQAAAAVAGVVAAMAGAVARAMAAVRNMATGATVTTVAAAATEIGGLGTASHRHHQNNTVHCKTSSKVREANPRRKLWLNLFGLEPLVRRSFLSHRAGDPAGPIHERHETWKFTV